MMDTSVSSKFSHILEIIKTRSEEEKETASNDQELLSNLGISILQLPQEAREQLKKFSNYQNVCQLRRNDPITMTTWYTEYSLEKMRQDDEILKLRQRVEEVDCEMEMNKKEIDDLKSELDLAQSSFSKQNPSPADIVDQINLAKQKLVSYTQKLEKAKNKFAALKVPPHLNPRELQDAMKRTVELRREEKELIHKEDTMRMMYMAKSKLKTFR